MRAPLAVNEKKKCSGTACSRPTLIPGHKRGFSLCHKGLPVGFVLVPRPLISCFDRPHILRMIEVALVTLCVVLRVCMFSWLTTVFFPFSSVVLFFLLFFSLVVCHDSNIWPALIPIVHLHFWILTFVLSLILFITGWCSKRFCFIIIAMTLSIQIFTYERTSMYRISYFDTEISIFRRNSHFYPFWFIVSKPIHVLNSMKLSKWRTFHICIMLSLITGSFV